MATARLTRQWSRRAPRSGSCAITPKHLGSIQADIASIRLTLSLQKQVINIQVNVPRNIPKRCWIQLESKMILMHSP
eukprot:6467266-Amphidinium_carterae.1